MGQGPGLGTALADSDHCLWDLLCDVAMSTNDLPK